MTSMEAHLKRETKMQKLRMATPIGLAINTVMSAGGFGLLIWLAVHFIEGTEKRMDNFETMAEQRGTALFQKINVISSKENADVLCLTKGLYKCCGEKADITC